MDPWGGRTRFRITPPHPKGLDTTTESASSPFVMPWRRLSERLTPGSNAGSCDRPSAAARAAEAHPRHRAYALRRLTASQPSSAPGVSMMKAVRARRGSRRSDPSPSGPIRPPPTCSWRSVRDPSSERESLRCTRARRSSPISASKRSTTCIAPASVEMSWPAPHRCAVSRQNASRSEFRVSPTPSRISASSSIVDPMRSPPPAEFSSTSRTPGGVLSRTARTFSTIRRVPPPAPEPRCEPMCTFTNRAP